MYGPEDVSPDSVWAINDAKHRIDRDRQPKSSNEYSKILIVNKDFAVQHIEIVQVELVIDIDHIFSFFINQVSTHNDARHARTNITRYNQILYKTHKDSQDTTNTLFA